MKQKTYTINKEFSIVKEDDAQIIGEFLERLKDRSTKAIFEKIKKSRKHVIASYIEWDTEKAALQHQLDQVRKIVQSIYIECEKVGDDEITRKAFHSVRIIGKENKREYKTEHETFSNSYYRDQTINSALKELEYWNKRYAEYRELAKLIEITDVEIKKIKEKHNK